MFNAAKNKTVVSIYEPLELPIENSEELAIDLDVVNSAKQQARINEPASESTSPDSNELNFSNKIKVKATQAINSVDQSISHLRDEIQRVSSSREIKDVQEMGEEFKNKVKAEFVPILKNLEVITLEYRGAEDDLQGFKRQHGLRRNADYPSSYWMTASILVMALIFESILNGTFLAAGVDTGLIGGVAMAFIIALVNIGFGFLLGWWLFRFKNHKSRLVSTASLVTFIVSLAIPLTFNLLVAHYRKALMLDPDNASQKAMQSFTDSILSIDDVNSWLLFSVGLLFSILAIYKGYRVDDAYPGYGKFARRKDELEDKIQDEREDALTHLEELHNVFLEKMNELYEEVEAKGKQVNGLSSAFDQQNRIYKTYISHLEDTLQYVIKLYRDTNTADRKSTAPEYFSDNIKVDFELSPLDISYQDKRNEMTEEREAISKLLPEIRSQMLSAKEDYHNKIEQVCQL